MCDVKSHKIDTSLYLEAFTVLITELADPAS